jgi:hypothetical protein
VSVGTASADAHKPIVSVIYSVGREKKKQKQNKTGKKTTTEVYECVI